MTITPMTSNGWVGGIFGIFCLAAMIIMPILTLVNYHRIRNGKESLYKGKVRWIVIVKKRVTEYEYSTVAYGYSRVGANTINGEPDGIARETIVDFRIVGRKKLYTKSVDEELFALLDVGKTYKVRLRFDCINKIYM